MFGCYRRGEANNPEVYTASVAAVLAEYPPDVINYVTDPRTGLPSKCDFLPTVKEIRTACEAEMAPQRAAAAREARLRVQFAEREMTEADRSNRPSYEELQQRCAEVGLHIGGRKAMGPREDPEAIRERMGISKEQWDAIPEAKAT